MMISAPSSFVHNDLLARHKISKNSKRYKNVVIISQSGEGCVCNSIQTRHDMIESPLLHVHTFVDPR